MRMISRLVHDIPSRKYAIYQPTECPSKHSAVKTFTPCVWSGGSLGRIAAWYPANWIQLNTTLCLRVDCIEKSFCLPCKYKKCISICSRVLGFPASKFRANSSSKIICNKVKRRFEFKFNQWLVSYKTQVRPHVEYCLGQEPRSTSSATHLTSCKMLQIRIADDPSVTDMLDWWRFCFTLTCDLSTLPLGGP